MCHTNQILETISQCIDCCICNQMQILFILPSSSYNFFLGGGGGGGGRSVHDIVLLILHNEY